MKLNVNSIRQRLRKLEQYINELEKQQSITPEAFRSDFTRQLAVERAFQAAIIRDFTLQILTAEQDME